MIMKRKTREERKQRKCKEMTKYMIMKSEEKAKDNDEEDEEEEEEKTIK